MYSFDITDKLRRKLEKLGKKDRVLALIFKKKMMEVISSDSVDRYKNLKSPKNEFKRIHLTDNFILLFKVEGNKVIFVDILHWDSAYK
jgi:mRNA-degrading endonuclease RelE of RelBE toxin-antitoxin system